MQITSFDQDFTLESIEDHKEAMLRDRHLSAVPPANQDDDGHDIVEYGSLMRGLLEELEKAHLYIASLNDVVTEQQNTLSVLSARVDALA